MKHQTQRAGPRPASSRMVRGAVGAAIVAMAVGCLTRPVGGLQPTTKTNFTRSVAQQSVSKLDLLFAIDNSRSMGDKQELLAEAVPDLIDRLLNPRCIDPANPGMPVLLRADGSCPAPAKFEFPAVYDMHVGIVSSSLGGGGAEQMAGQPGNGTCDESLSESGKDPNTHQALKYNGHNDDKGHLLNRKLMTVNNKNGLEDGVDDAKALPTANPVGGSFLAWLPANDPHNAKADTPTVTREPDAKALQADFTTLVRGVNQYGCGLEAQLESWYRFLIQPDPYRKIVINRSSNPPIADLQGVDETILQQRADFLRPDSLVAIIMLTDEEDSWSDPLGIGAHGWATRVKVGDPGFPGSATGLMPRGTSYCDEPINYDDPTHTGPNGPNCTWCLPGARMSNGHLASEDPNCQLACDPVRKPGCVGFYGPEDDALNTRYVNDMKRRYGVDPQFPVSRYVYGLKSERVPNRNDEHPTTGSSYNNRDINGRFTADGEGYKSCLNPLYRAALDGNPDGDLCQASGKVGPRTSDLIYFAIIGGVPWQLLSDFGADGSSVFKRALSDFDWQAILGRDPAHFDLTGIDPHMIESYLPRLPSKSGRIPYLSSSLPPNAPPHETLPQDTNLSDTADPFNGREWETQKLSAYGLDLQYACTFDLPKEKDCDVGDTFAGCDCVKDQIKAGGPPLCKVGADGLTKNRQYRGKAYPTIRELRVAHDLGPQAIVASLCPKDPLNKTIGDAPNPDYGYRPAINAIIDRLKNKLGGQCLPQPLQVDSSGAVPCLVIEQLTALGPQSGACDGSKGFIEPDSAVLSKFNAQRCAEARATGRIPRPSRGQPDACTNADAIAALLGPVCEVVQLPKAALSSSGTCEDGVAGGGWCYVEGRAAGICPQAIKLTPLTQTVPGNITLQCIEASVPDNGGP